MTPHCGKGSSNVDLEMETIASDLELLNCRIMASRCG